MSYLGPIDLSPSPPPLPNKTSRGVIVLTAIVSLGIGGVGGFLLGVASTEAGRKFLMDVIEAEQQADVAVPQSLVREKFQLRYPANWKIDVTDEDYDPDSMFSIDSPGSTYVMFVISDGKTDIEENVRNQIAGFQKLMGSPAIERWQRFGKYSGAGATLRARIMGIKTTVKVFSFNDVDSTAVIIQQYPDEDDKYVRDGLALIESSFSLDARN